MSYLCKAEHGKKKVSAIRRLGGLLRSDKEDSIADEGAQDHKRPLEKESERGKNCMKFLFEKNPQILKV